MTDTPLPVAWQKRNADNDWTLINDCSDENLYELDKAGWETRPLYYVGPASGSDELPKWLKDAFDSDSLPKKNIALRMAYDEIVRLTDLAQAPRVSQEIGFAELDRLTLLQAENERLRAALKQLLPTPVTSTDREYDPDVAPCDDAEFGMRP
jgi:hypothetical protein